MAEHKHGSMDSSVQEKTYASFITFITRTTIALIVLALFLAIFAA
ncbi:aa3-type cytochrome c oxidase subunit IV [Cribrihabitans neustonicus]